MPRPGTKGPRFSYAIILLGVLSGVISFAQNISGTNTPGEPEPSNLPVGVLRTQLRGTLSAPPLHMPPYGVLCSTTDRRLSLIGYDGGVVWSRELPRLPHGPLVALGAALCIVAYGGDSFAAYRMDGSRFWEIKAPFVADSALAVTEEGHLVCLTATGTIRIMTVAAELLYELPANQGSTRELRSDETGVYLLLKDGQVQYVDADGSLSPTQPQRVLHRAGNSVRFLGNQTQSGYEIRITSSFADIGIPLSGKLGHWSVDNRGTGFVFWGDDRWRLFQYNEALRIGTFPATATMPHKPLLPLFSGSSRERNLELRYIKSLLAIDDTTGFGLALEYLAGQIEGPGIKGKLGFYEDALIEILSLASANQLLVQYRIRAWNLLGRFPSYRHSARLGRLFSTETDTEVLHAGLLYCLQLAQDPEGHFRGRLTDLYERYVRNSLPGLSAYTVRGAYFALSASWPPN